MVWLSTCKTKEIVKMKRKQYLIEYGFGYAWFGIGFYSW
jgi:hypothetical protein